MTKPDGAKIKVLIMAEKGWIILAPEVLGD